MGITIGHVLISYDIKSKHNEVRQKLEDLGYADSFNFKNETITYNLPNTTFWHHNKSSNQAMLDLKAICSQLNINLEKAITVRASEFVGF